MDMPIVFDEFGKLLMIGSGLIGHDGLQGVFQ